MKIDIYFFTIQNTRAVPFFFDSFNEKGEQIEWIGMSLQKSATASAPFATCRKSGRPEDNDGRILIAAGHLSHDASKILWVGLKGRVLVRY